MTEALSLTGGPLPSGMYHRASTGRAWPQAPAPSPDELAGAMAIVRRSTTPSPLAQSRALSKMFDRRVWLKLESTSPVGSFKYRGALVAINRVSLETGARAVITASTGNHGQGVAYAASSAGLETIVYIPMGVADEKVAAMRALGAEIRVHGANLAEAQQKAEQVAFGDSVYIEDGENGDLMAGAATVLAEILEERSDLETILVPIGGGNLIAGSLLARQSRESSAQVVGVQSTSASAATESWLQGQMLERPCSTFAGGLATTRPGNLALDVMKQYLATSVLVDDEDLYRAMGMAIEAAGVAMEGAAAAPIAALARFGKDIAGDDVALVVTGNWPSKAETERAIDTYHRSLD